MLPITQIEYEIHQIYPDMAIFCFDELDSTSLYLKQYAKTELREAFCFTGFQRRGYGQQSRVRQSDHSSLTFSMLLHISAPLNAIDGLTQLIALKVVESLACFSEQSFKIKWPNDLYVQDQKAGGILTESVSFSDSDCWIVVGIGLNSGLNFPIKDTITNCLKQSGSIAIKENDNLGLLKQVLKSQLHLAHNFRPGMFKNYLVNFRLVDFFQSDQAVIVYDSGTKQPGYYKGLNDNGELLVEMEGVIRTFRSGQTSIRPVI